MGVAPIEVSLSVGVCIDRRVDVIPIALVPNQWFAERILEWAIGRICFQNSDAMSVERGIEIVFPIVLYSLDSPGAVFTRAPGDVFQ